MNAKTYHSGVTLHLNQHVFNDIRKNTLNLYDMVRSIRSHVSTKARNNSGISIFAALQYVLTVEIFM